MHKYRTHHCSELTLDNIGQKVKLSGWIHRKRDHGNLLFVDLRDHYGITQLVIDSSNKELEKIAHIRNESVITVVGQVVGRTEDTINKSVKTGYIEVVVSECSVESESDFLPLQVNSEQDSNEEIRLKHRYLDLRREKVHNNMILRSKVISYIRKEMSEMGFLEMQTPILTASSPEGARDFLVPSRLHQGKFYALPQAPQIFKQLLMVSGFDRYFQIAPCFRDEDSRADRSPGEFYQLDVEMAFVTQEDVFSTIEPMIYKIFSTFSNKKVSAYPFPRIPYRDSMLMYGSDKPDLRNPLKIADVTDIFAESSFSIFVNGIKKGQVVRAIPAPKTANNPRSFFDKMIEFAQEKGASGLAYISYEQETGEGKGPIAKFLTTEQHSAIQKKLSLGRGDAVFFSCDKELMAAKIAGVVRNEIADKLDLIDKNQFALCWITDFPYFEFNEEIGKIDFSHNPFSMPQGGMATLEAAKTQEDYLNILAHQYDIVCNGVELCSGAIRNHKPEIMYKAFALAGYGKEVVDQKFSGLINAFRYGAPPHGGLAPGIDRMVMLLADEANIREVTLFPMNQKGEDMMMKAPCEVSPLQLKELGIEIATKVKNKQ